MIHLECSDAQIADRNRVRDGGRLHDHVRLELAQDARQRVVVARILRDEAHLGVRQQIEAFLDRRPALRVADFVVNTIQVGGAPATRLDFEIPARYGLRYTINDTINVGTLMRSQSGEKSTACCIFTRAAICGGTIGAAITRTA